MLGRLISKNSNHPGLKLERSTYKTDFIDYLSHLPDSELMGQLYHFSPTCNIQEATRELNATVHLVGLTEKYNEFVDQFNKQTCNNLAELHLRQGRTGTVQYTDLPSSILVKLESEKAFVDQFVQ